MLTNDILTSLFLSLYTAETGSHLGVGLPGPVPLDEDAAQDALDGLQAGVPLTRQQGGQGVHVPRCHQLLETSVDESGQQSPSPACQTL